MANNVKYFTVPIGLLRGLISGRKDIKDFVQDVVRYSLYYHAVHLPYSHDDEDEGIEANKMTNQSSRRFSECPYRQYPSMP